MIIRNNLNATTAYHLSRKTSTELQKNLEKLSSGYRINRAGDDAAGLSVSEKIRAKITELGRCQKNISEGLDVARTADAALQEVNDILKRARELCIDAENGTYGDNELIMISDEINQLFSEIDRITASAQYNSISLFRGEIHEAEEVKLLDVHSPLEITSSTAKVESSILPEITAKVAPKMQSTPSLTVGQSDNTSIPVDGEDGYFLDEDGRKFHYEYEESIVPTVSGPGNWGNLSFVSSESFDRASQPKAATAVIHLDDTIDFNDVTSLVGRTITVGTGTGYRGARTFYFTDGTVKSPNIPTSVQKIDITSWSYNTTEKALAGLCSAIQLNKDFTSVESATFDAASRTITLTAALKDLDAGEYSSDGNVYPNVVTGGDGSWANGTLIATTYRDEPSLKQIDGAGASNNPVKYSTTAYASISLSRVHKTLTDEDIRNLNGNSLDFSGHTIYFKDLNLSVGTTKAEFGAIVADEINKFADCSASYNKKTGSIDITLSGLSSDVNTAGDIHERRTSEIFHTDVQNLWNSNPATFTSQVISNATSEAPEVSQVTVSFDSTGPFSFVLNGQKYLYHNSNTHSLSTAGTSEIAYDGSKDAPVIVDIAGMSDTEIIDHIAQNFRDNIHGSVSVSGNTLTVTAGNINRPMNLDTNLQGSSIAVTSNTKIIDTAATTGVIGPKTSTYLTDFKKSAKVEFSLGNTFNKSKLVGSGFTVGTYKIEFTSGSGVSDTHEDIDISSCSSFNDLKSLIATSAPNYGNYSLSVDDSNPNDVKLVVEIQSATVDPVIVDGNEGSKGLIKGDTATYENGSNAGFSEKELDFSSVNESNLNDLLGKGFRINCSTCSGEYINIFFCWEKDASMPENFTQVDDKTGATRTIHNIAVELSKIKSGDAIVQNIVNQVKPNLNHFMDLSVGSSPTKLVARDKRIGDVLDEHGNVSLGSIQTGVAANFEYKVTVKKVYDDPPVDPPTPPDPPDKPNPPVIPDPPVDPDPIDPKPDKPKPGEPTPDDPLDETIRLRCSNMMIYVGSDPTAQYIPIHLPYIDMNTLRLNHQAKVDLTTQSTSDWLNRIDTADRMIASARGTIGADYNKLQHAKKDLSNYNENLSDAYSIIRDTDMAQTMMKHVKDQILTRTQYSMLAQANQTPYRVLQLIR